MAAQSVSLVDIGHGTLFLGMPYQTYWVKCEFSDQCGTCDMGRKVLLRQKIFWN